MIIYKVESFLLAGARWATGGEKRNYSHQVGSVVPDPDPIHPDPISKGHKNPVMQNSFIMRDPDMIVYL